jgi:hypothetical protein
MNSLPPPPAVLTHAVAANMVAIGPTDPSANTVDDLQVPQFSAPGVSFGQINRGDYQVTVQGQNLVYTKGILLASIAQHDRSDFVGRRATVEAGRNPFSDGYMSLSINEVNFNTSVAWFAFEAGWQGAHVNSTGILPPTAFNGVTQSMVSRTDTGRYQVNLGVDSRTDGMLFVIGNNNDNVVAQTGPKASGAGWEIRVTENSSNFGATGIDKDWSFVYLPYETRGLVGGWYDGTTNSTISSVGNFTMARLTTGQYELTIPGESPTTGMLILTVAKLATASGVTGPDDNILTYQANAAGHFLINSYDLPGIGFQDTGFAWAFIKFSDPLAPAHAGDFDSDGDVDGADFVVWQTNFPFTPTPGAAPVPEPSTILLALISLPAIGCAIGRRRSG